MTSWLLAFFIALLVGAIVTRLVMWLDISDAPDEARKNHQKITPTSGGLGIVGGVVAGLAAGVATSQFSFTKPVAAVMVLALFGAVLGLADDIKAIGSRRKLAAMALASAGFVVLGARIEVFYLTPDLSLPLGAIIGGLGTLLWLLVIVNTTNFMDGANGLAMGCAGTGLFGLCLLNMFRVAAGGEGADFGFVAWIGFAACLGFLVWNAWRGSIFAGDCGALFVGFLSGGLGVLAVNSGINPFCVAMCFLPMLTDVILTIVRRLRHGENVLTAHSQHVYQMSIRAGASHIYTSYRYWVQTAASVICALAAQKYGGWAPLGLFVLTTAFLSWIYLSSYRLIQPNANKG
jgi:UDP-GlcNAc:undecaprenyl-phosphate/decaprenyl-phosphate GlcNAc-1-phosphate transferase